MNVTPNAVDRPLGKKRTDIEGLRALAIIFVFGYHLYPAQVPGGFIGVDVFFVISGFLITDHLYREFRATDRLRPLAFYARRIRRLLPASFLVLAFSLVVTAVVVPVNDVIRFAAGVGASALYVTNWFLVFFSSGYVHAGDSASIIQQYWTLSVEEQFYFLWPLLFLAALFVLRKVLKRGRGQQWLFPAVLGFIFIASLVASIWFTDANPEQAFFSTFTRVWEFALGGLIVFVPPVLSHARSRARKVILIFSAWSAGSALFAAAWVFNDATPFPGYAALWPVLATAVLLYVGDLGTPWEPARLARFRPVLFIGGLSYVIYLWHWPIIVTFELVRGRSSGWKIALVIIALTLAAAVATKYLVENPLRFGTKLRTTRRALIFAAVGSLVLVAGATGVGINTQLQGANAPALGVPFANVSAVQAAIAHQVITNTWDVPPKSAPRTRPSNWDLGCLDVDSADKVASCTFGDPRGTHVLAVIGDSFANEYISGLVDGFAPRGWKVISLTHSQCPTVDFALHLDKVSTEYMQCAQHREWVLQELKELHPDIVVASNATAWEQGLLMLPTDSHDRGTTWNAGLTRYLDQVTALSPSVVVLAESPGGGPNCHIPTPLSSCKNSTGFSWGFLDGERQAALAAGATHVDTRDWFCTSDHNICPEAIAGTFVTGGRGDNHLSDQYSRLLANVLYQSVTGTKN